MALINLCREPDFGYPIMAGDEWYGIELIANGNTSDYVYSYLADTDITTPTNRWVGWKFFDAQPVSKIRFYNDNNSDMQGFKLWYSNDGATWTEITTITTTTAGWKQATFSVISAKYWRITGIFNAGSSTMDINEIEIYADYYDTTNLIPPYSSNLCTSGTIISSGWYSPERIFNSNLYDEYGYNFGTHQWIGYQFPSATEIRMILSYNSCSALSSSPSQVSAQYSDDGNTWTTAITITVNRSISGTNEYIIPNGCGSHAYWRLYAYSNESDWDLSKIFMMEVSSYIIRNPEEYTDNLCIGGTVICTPGDLQWYNPEYAFDGIMNTGNDATGYTYNGGLYIGYHFSSPKSIRKVVYNTGWLDGYVAPSIAIQYSDDGSTWELAGWETFLPNTGQTKLEFNIGFDVGSHSYWSLYTDPIASNNTWKVNEIQMMAEKITYTANLCTSASNIISYDPVWSRAATSAERLIDGSTSGDVSISYSSSNYNQAYIGYDFSKNIKIRRITLTSSITSNPRPTSITIQYSDDTINWTTIPIPERFPLSVGNLVKDTFDFTTYDNGHRFWRVIPGEGTSATSWFVTEMEMMAVSSGGLPYYSYVIFR